MMAVASMIEGASGRSTNRLFFGALVWPPRYVHCGVDAVKIAHDQRLVIKMVSRFFLIACSISFGGCAAERAMVAQDAQNKMVGLSKEQVLTCMGPPVAKSAEGQTEVWTYNSGNGHTSVTSFSNSNAVVTAQGNGMGGATASGTGFGNSFSVASQRYCVVNVVMTGGTVSKLNYSGPTGGPITGGEQCAFAVRNCVQ